MPMCENLFVSCARILYPLTFADALKPISSCPTPLNRRSEGDFLQASVEIICRIISSKAA